MIYQNKEKINKDFKELDLKNCYFFQGEETLFKIELLNLISSNLKYKGNPFDLVKIDGDNFNLSSLFSDCQTPPLKENKKIIIIKKAEKIKTTQMKEICEFSNEIPSFTSLIIRYDKEVKKNDALSKYLEDSAFTICNFSPLTEIEALDFLQNVFKDNNKDISKENLNMLISIIGTSPSLLKMEAEKLILYTKNKKVIEEKDILNSSPFEKQGNTQELINIILNGDKNKLKELTENLIKNNEDPNTIIITLTIALEKILKMVMLKEAKLLNNSALSYSIGIFYSEAKNFSMKNNISKEKALRVLKRCLEAQYLLRTSSGRDPKILIKNIIFEIYNII